MSNPKDTINKLLNDYYQKKGLNPAIQVAHELLKKPVISQTDMSTQELNAIFNGEVCETVLQIMIQDFMKRNPTRTASWRYNKSVILSDLETQSSKFLTEIDALLFTPECIYIFECKSYAGDKQLVGKGTIKRSNGNDCDVYSQNSLHLKILKQWLNRFSQHPFYQMVLFDFSSGTMDDKRTASAKKELPLVTDTNLFQLLHTSRLGVWHAEDIDLISKRFATETEKLHAKHLDYVKSINHRRPAMTIIKIEHELTEEQEKKIMDAINAIVPDDMFCCPPRMIDDVIASKIWTKDDVKGAIEESGYELTEEILNQTILDMEDMATLNDCQDYEWDFINGSIKDAYEEILARRGWIKTDDTQYLKKLRAGVYKLVQSTELPDGNYSVFTNTIVIANWMDSDGMYDANCRSIMKSYYGSIEKFEDKYPDPEHREQVLAEMLFESTCSYDSEETETVNDKLKAQKVIDKFLFLRE